MSLSGSLEQTSLPAALEQAADTYGSGAMHVTGDPGGVVYLSQRGVSYIETEAAPGLDVLLVRSGRICDHDWLAAFDAGQSAAEVGQIVVARGLLGRRELEVFTLSAIFDAALYVLPMTSGNYRFVPDTPHWLGAVRPVPVAMLLREVTRRQAMLDRLRAPALTQTARVTPVPRLPGGRVTVTARQWAVLMHASGQHTVRDLAWTLGRGVFAVTIEVHRLIARGLIEVTGNVADAQPAEPAAALPQRRPGSSWPGPAPRRDAPASAPWAGTRRTPAGTDSYPQVDIYTLKRLVDRLEALA